MGPLGDVPFAQISACERTTDRYPEFTLVVYSGSSRHSCLHVIVDHSHGQPD
jgi:hypothetical protein